MALTSRPLNVKDHPALINLWVKSWQQALPQIDFEARREWFTVYLPKLEEQGFKLLGAFDQNQPLLGFVAIHPQTHILDQIAVSIKAKGQNIGAELIKSAKLISPQKIILTVNTDNSRAIAFYKKHGFVESGVKSANITSGLNCMEMQWC